MGNNKLMIPGLYYKFKSSSIFYDINELLILDDMIFDKSGLLIGQYINNNIFLVHFKAANYFLFFINGNEECFYEIDRSYKIEGQFYPFGFSIFKGVFDKDGRLLYESPIEWDQFLNLKIFDLSIFFII